MVGAILCCIPADAEVAPDSTAETAPSLTIKLPEVHGYVRTGYEWDTSHGYNRFQVRNARISLAGKILPDIGYMIQTDFCDRGKIKVLDAYANVSILKGFSFQAGQFLMPMGVEPVRAPFNNVFADVAYLGSVVCAPRAVGAEIAYTFPRVPLKIMASCFNPTTISDHSPWNRAMACSAQAILTLGDISLSGSFMSTQPYSIRTNMSDAAVTYSSSRLTLEAEYIHEHYGHDAYKGVHAYSAYADYRIPVKAGIFNRLSFQSRFDGMTDHSSGKPDDKGILTTDDPARKRLTIGATITSLRNKSWADIRINYQKVWFGHDMPAPRGEGDKLVAELAIRF